MIDYSKILTYNYAGSEWALDGDFYEGLVWFSNTQKPTKEELDALWESTQAQELAKKQSAIDAKASAYAKLTALGLTSDEIKAITG
jgi:hypothetical protein